MNEVLIIEDQRSFAIMISTLITERFGYETTVATSIEEADAFLQGRHKGVFVAIVDLNLPGSERGAGIDLVWVAEPLATQDQLWGAPMAEASGL